MTSPLVTFALLTYNQASYVREAVEGALAQDYTPLEIVISDDGSTDGTLDVVRDVLALYTGPHRVRVLTSAQNTGLASNLNRAFGAAHGEFIVPAAGDDIPFPNKASRLVGLMLADESVMGVHTSVIQIDREGRQLGKRTPPSLDKMNDLSAIINESLAVAGQSHAFRATVHQHFGPFDPALTHEGKALAFRERALGKILYLDEPATYYRIGSGVSTYDGADAQRLTLQEPRKIAGWKYSAIRQIEVDLERVPGRTAELAGAVRQRREFLARIYEINTQPFAVKALLGTANSANQFAQAFRAFARSNAPDRVRNAYAMWLLSRKRGRTSQATSSQNP